MKTDDSIKARVLVVLGVLRSLAVAPFRWFIWNLWGRRAAAARLKELAGIGLPAPRTPSDWAAPEYMTYSPQDAHVEHYNKPREKLPPPDFDDAGVN